MIALRRKLLGLTVKRGPGAGVLKLAQSELGKAAYCTWRAVFNIPHAAVEANIDNYQGN